MQFNRGKILHLGKNNSVHQYIVGGHAAGKNLGRKGPGRHQAEHEPTKCPCGKGGEWAPFDTGVSAS